MFPTLRNGNNTNLFNRNYSVRLRCHFCRRSGHRYESCPIHLLSRLYSCINHERNHESICFQIIRAFSITELTSLFVAIHEERNISYSSNLLSEPFYNIVPIIASIFLNEELAFENENFPTSLNTENLSLPTLRVVEGNEIQENEISPEQNSQRMEVVEEEPGEFTRWGRRQNIEPRRLPSLNPNSFSPNWPSRNNQSSPSIQQIETINIIHDLPFIDENTIVETPDSDDDTDQNENINTNNLYEESDEYWRLPPLLDISGNIFSDENIILPRSEEVITNTPSSPIQIILNQTINVIPISISNTTEETICPVCYENFQEKSIIKTDCGHCFCFGCVKKFTENNKNCPMCRNHISKLNINMEVLECHFIPNFIR